MHLNPVPKTIRVTQSSIEFLRLASIPQQIGRMKTRYVIGPQLIRSAIVPSLHVGNTAFADSATGDQEFQIVPKIKVILMDPEIANVNDIQWITLH